MRRGIAMVGTALLILASCSGRMPTVDQTNAVVSRLRDYDAWAWAVGIGLIMFFNNSRPESEFPPWILVLKTTAART